MSRQPTVGGDNGGWGAILNDYLSVSLSTAGIVQRVGTSADTSRAITPGGQTNALSHQLQLPVVTSTLQYVGLTIESTGGANGGGVIPLYIGNQTGASTGGLWGVNVVLQQNAASTRRQIIGYEVDINNNLSSATLNQNSQVGVSVVSAGSKAAGVGYLVSGTPQWIDAVLVANSAIAPGGYAFRYIGSSSQTAGVAITHDSKIQIGFISAIGNPNEIHLLNNTNIQGLNAPQTNFISLVCVSTISGVMLSPGGTQIQWGPTNTALGGGAAATLGTVGAAGPPSAAQKEWMPVQTSSGAQRWIPVWSSS
jgi:hypothetical protein